MARRRGRYVSRGGKPKANTNDLMQQMQQMQVEMERIQGETEQEVVTATAGGGMVELSITGGLEVQNITIKPEVVDPDDVEMLEDLVMAAVNEGIQKAQALMSDRMSALTGGLDIPGM